MKNKKFINVLYKTGRLVYRKVYAFYSRQISQLIFWCNDIETGEKFKCNGIPVVDIKPMGSLKFGNNVSINNGAHYNRIGRQQKCQFVVNHGGEISIGSNVGLSAVTIVSHCKVEIGNDVLIGGNTVIYDTDFHPISIVDRKLSHHNQQANKMPVIIGDGVFIGAHTTILKGVQIGPGSVVGAGSVVSKNIPANEIWGGNPAKFIKYLTNE